MSELNDIESLLPLYCEGLVTEEERIKVESWLRESEENRRIARQIEMLYMATDTLNVKNAKKLYGGPGHNVWLRCYSFHCWEHT